MVCNEHVGPSPLVDGAVGSFLSARRRAYFDMPLGPDET
jgi:hypothetical protein